MRSERVLLFCIAAFCTAVVNAQIDSTLQLPAAEVEAAGNDAESKRLRGVEGTTISVGKRNEVITVRAIDANKAVNNARQLYARVPGLNIQESDPGGLQLSIAARGLDPHRSSNFNLRQNGYDISADALGYPEAYYTPPMEAVERIVVIRGAASLQYGPQFGGLIDFKLEAPPKALIAFRTVNTVGSYGLRDSWNRLGGTKGKIAWSAAYGYRQGGGWRPNTAYDAQMLLTTLSYRPRPTRHYTLEYTRSTYLAQQPGGLSDRQFATDPSLSRRARNWFGTTWNILAFRAGHRNGHRSEWDLRAWGFLGERNALGLVGDINRTDDPDLPRDLIHDAYRNAGTELRYLQRDTLGRSTHTWLVGTRLYSGHTRKAQGLASNGSDADMRFTSTGLLESSEFDFPGLNAAFFAEDVIALRNSRWQWVPGLRAEVLDTRAHGYYRRNLGTTVLPGAMQEDRSLTRAFLLAGMAVVYDLRKAGRLQANLSRNYRGITFTDMRVTGTNQTVDPNLRDEHGYNLDIAWRSASHKRIFWDLGVFLLRYNDRIGQVQQVDRFYNVVRHTTNVGASRSYGAELYVEARLLPGKASDHKGSLSVYSATAWTDARYTASPYPSVVGKRVEFSPELIARAGLLYRRGGSAITLQAAHTAQQYTEASNARFTPNAVNGLIPAYQVMDLTIRQRIRAFEIRAGVNNLFDALYFTRRAASYPGPGIIPAERRSFHLTLSFDGAFR